MCYRPDGEIGRHTGLKIRRPKGCAGSTPARGTIQNQALAEQSGAPFFYPDFCNPDVYPQSTSCQQAPPQHHRLHQNVWGMAAHQSPPMSGFSLPGDIGACDGQGQRRAGTWSGKGALEPDIDRVCSTVEIPLSSTE
jgi:hypothetical protein